MKKRMLVVSLLLAVSMLAGCASAPKQAASVSYDSVPMESRGVFAGEAEAPAAEPAMAALDSDSDLPDARIIIRTVDMSIVVEDTDATLAQIRQMAESFEGYIASSNRWLVNDQPRANITLRIPAESLDAALDSLRDASVRVESETSSGQDVTEEYVDIDARLRNLQATEEELLALLTEVRENRGDAEDILAIYREITSIRSQIESLQGRKNYLSRMAALATVNIQITPKDQPVTVVEKDTWSPLVTLSNAGRSFVRVFQHLADVLIYLLILSPFVLLPVLVLWLIVRAIRKRQAKKKAAAS